jgi:hypothetical protein
MPERKKADAVPDGSAGKTRSFASLILNRVHTFEKSVEKNTPSEIKTAPKIQIPEPVISVETQLLQSQAAKQKIAKAAQENQDHYLLMQMEDHNRKAWFMYPKYDYQYSEFVLITPEMAQTMIDHLWSKEEGNRNTKPPLVEAYKRDIENDHWIPTDESIGVNLAFEVYNGRHRLLAIIGTGRAMPMYVTWNVLNEAKFFIESGAIRSLPELCNW